MGGVIRRKARRVFGQLGQPAMARVGALQQRYTRMWIRNNYNEPAWYLHRRPSRMLEQ